MFACGCGFEEACSAGVTISKDRPGIGCTIGVDTLNHELLTSEKAHLASLLEAVQRCVFFLDASTRKLIWPLRAEDLLDRKQDVTLFESLAAINERFAKLQDTLGAAMRHAALLAGEPVDSFLKVLVFYEKCGVIASAEQWQLYRTIRNLAAHDYETDYAVIAEHFNTLNQLLPALYTDAGNFSNYCDNELDVVAETKDFESGFLRVAQSAFSEVKK